MTANKNGGTAAQNDEESMNIVAYSISWTDITIVDPKPEGVFLAGQRELARDLIIKEQQIEYLVSQLPGLENSEKDQEQRIRQLEKELKEAEEERKAAVKEKEVVLGKLENVIRSVKRP